MPRSLFGSFPDPTFRYDYSDEAQFRMTVRKALGLVLPDPPTEYDRENEAQFRRALAMALMEEGEDCPPAHGEISCAQSTGHLVDIGDDRYHVFDESGSLAVLCPDDREEEGPIFVDIIAWGEGGDGGGNGATDGEDSIVWVDEDGFATEELGEVVVRARGGGLGGYAGNGQPGGSGGGGGGQSAHTGNYATAGGSASVDGEQGYPGGGGRSRLGLFDWRQAVAGGGGGFGGPGEYGALLGLTRTRAGKGGPGASLFGGSGVWPAVLGGHGGDGKGSGNNSSTPVKVGGGGGAGGVVVREAVKIMPGEEIQVDVGGVGDCFDRGDIGNGGDGSDHTGGDTWTPGGQGRVIIRERKFAVVSVPAVLEIVEE